MNPIELRVHVYEHLVAHGVPPTCGEIGAHFGESAEDARAALGALRIGKTILVHPKTGEIWMAGPFAAAPTPYRVSRGEARWFANCAWDMLGIPFIVGGDVHIDASCVDCGAPMAIRGGLRGAPDIDAVVHFLVPARRWYDDIGFT